jgi:hypothetical protein
VEVSASRAFEILIEEMGNIKEGELIYNNLYIVFDKAWRRIREEEGR